MRAATHPWRAPGGVMVISCPLKSSYRLPFLGSLRRSFAVSRVLVATGDPSQGEYTMISGRQGLAVAGGIARDGRASCAGRPD